MNKLYFITAIAILLVSCSIKRAPIANKAPKSSNNFNILSNEGTICIKKVTKNNLKITYLPLSTKCASSSMYNWKMNDIQVKQNASSIAIETYSLYKKSNSQMATADCAGAGIKSKNISTSTQKLKILWGKTDITALSSISRVSCFKRVGEKIVKVNTP